MTSYLIQGPITPAQIALELEGLSNRKDSGGHSVFLGQVRDDVFDGKKVKAIEYSAYNEMVAIEAEKIKKIISDEYDDVLSIVILHSAGIVMAGEFSLLVIVSAGHRDHATKACRQALELIKERLPVWKKELFDDDTHRWQHNS
jgi:molybdopterin synthase catalytic subunit